MLVKFFIKFKNWWKVQLTLSLKYDKGKVLFLKIWNLPMAGYYAYQDSIPMSVPDSYIPY